MTSAAPIEPTPTRHQPFAVRDSISGRQLAVVVSISLAVVIATSVVASNGEVATWEAHALRFFNDWPDWLEPIMWVLQQVGVLAGPLIGGVVIAVVARRREYAVPFVLLMPLKLILEKLVLKQLVERQRPFVTVGPDITVRGPAFEGLSFPSGHTTTAFASRSWSQHFCLAAGGRSPWSGRLSSGSPGCTWVNTICST